MVIQQKGISLWSRKGQIYNRDVLFNESEKTGSSIDSSSTTRCSEDTDKLVIEFDSNDNTDQEEETDEASQPPEPVRGSTRERRQPEYYGRERVTLTLPMIPGSKFNQNGKIQ